MRNWFTCVQFLLQKKGFVEISSMRADGFLDFLRTAEDYLTAYHFQWYDVRLQKINKVVDAVILRGLFLVLYSCKLLVGGEADYLHKAKTFYLTFSWEVKL